MNQVSGNEEIVKIQSRGVLTIPSRFRDDNFGQDRFVRMRKQGGKLVLEPVTILNYPVRRYTDGEVKEFLKYDEEETKSLV